MRDDVTYVYRALSKQMSDEQNKWHVERNTLEKRITVFEIELTEVRMVGDTTGNQ